MRLTNALRNKIRDRLIADRFDKEAKDIETEGFSLGRTVYQASFTKEEHELLFKLPTGWLSTEKYLQFKVGDEYCQLYTGCRHQYPQDKMRRCCVQFTENSIIGRRYLQYKAQLSEHKKLREQAYNHVYAVLKSCASTRRLTECWPEIAGLVDEICGERVVTKQLAVQFDKVNALLGLGNDQANKSN